MLRLKMWVSFKFLLKMWVSFKFLFKFLGIVCAMAVLSRYPITEEKAYELREELQLKRQADVGLIL